MGWSVGEQLAFTRGLGFRLVALLSIAILPIGLISLMQTLTLTRAVTQAGEIVLEGRTAAAAAGERAILQGAIGSTKALAPVLQRYSTNHQACSALLSGFVRNNPYYVGVSFVNLDGQATCEAGEVTDPARLRAAGGLIEGPRPVIRLDPKVGVSGHQFVVVIQPIYQDARLAGHIVINLMQESLRDTHSKLQDTASYRIATFNRSGEILASNMSPDQLVGIMPREPIDLSSDSLSFRAEAEDGRDLAYSIVPVLPDLVYSIGIWTPEDGTVGGRFGASALAALVPICLWLASLAVAYFAVYRLVLRHIAVLRGQMRQFAIGKRDAPPPILESAPAEIADVSRTFHNMARILIRDEATLEEIVSEKTVLLKEVHHRVKNNLQLIVSIINMQSRVLADDEARAALGSIQDRVASLATIYQNLYQAESLDRVAADRLIRDIINHMVRAQAEEGLDVSSDLEPITMLPDQAVPLSLLATEALTNALKYGQQGDEGGRIKVQLSREGDTARFTISNHTKSEGSAEHSTKLGGQLIEAFRLQLDGEMTVTTDNGIYCLVLTFPIQSVTRSTVDLTTRRVNLTSAARKGAKH